MTLEKRIDLTEQTLYNLKSLREKYKRPKQVDSDIAFYTEILGYLKELQEFKSNLAERPQVEFTDLEQKVIADAINHLLDAELLEENGYTEEVINALNSVLQKIGAEEE